MSVDVQTEIVINRPLAVVSAFATEPEMHRVNVKPVEWRTAPPAKLGSKIAFAAHFPGRHMAYTYEIVEWKPGERLVMRTAEGPFPMDTTYTWEAAAGGTRMKLRNAGEPEGSLHLLRPSCRWPPCRWPRAAPIVRTWRGSSRFSKTGQREKSDAYAR